MKTNPVLSIVFVTVPNVEVGRQLAQCLVTESLAACVNIVEGVRSVYRWQGNLEESSELLLIIKTPSERLDNLEAKILELHPYDTPEIVALEASSVTERYLNWART